MATAINKERQLEVLGTVEFWLVRRFPSLKDQLDRSEDEFTDMDGALQTTVRLRVPTKTTGLFFKLRDDKRLSLFTDEEGRDSVRVGDIPIDDGNFYQNLEEQLLYRLMRFGIEPDEQHRGIPPLPTDADSFDTFMKAYMPKAIDDSEYHSWVYENGVDLRLILEDHERPELLSYDIPHIEDLQLGEELSREQTFGSLLRVVREKGRNFDLVTSTVDGIKETFLIWR